MRAHIDLVGLLFVVWGLLTVVVGLSMLALGISAFALLASGGGQFAAGLAGGIFTTLATIAIIWGVAHVVVGMPLRRLQHWSRQAALMLGSVDLLLLPFGTAIGCYALFTLLREDGKRLFQ